MQTKALQSTPNINIGTSTVHVYSLPSNVIRQYEVVCNGSQLGAPSVSDGSFASNKDIVARGSVEEQNAACPSQRLAIEMTPDHATKVYFDALYQVFVETGGTMVKDLTLPAGSLPATPTGTTAYDVVNSPSRRALISDQMQIDPLVVAGLSNAANFLFQGANSYLGFSDGMILKITLEFSDGSSCVFEWRQGSDTFEYKPDSARTEGGQLIPDDEVDADGSDWSDPGPYGNGDDLRRMVDRLQRMGIPVYRGDGGLIPTGSTQVGPIRKIRCTRENGRVVCRIVPT